jgi:ribosomal protein S18 acetylase RimI-like enzyme
MTVTALAMTKNMLRFIAEADFDALVAALNDAFSDYLVPMHMTAPQLRGVCRRRGVVLELSPAVFDDAGRIAAYTLNALGMWNGVPSAYDAGTGVVPSHRRRGLARQLLEVSFPALRARGAKQMILEVLEENERAVALYRALGFEVTRRMTCWRYAGPAALDPEAVEIAIDDVPAAFCDVAPSWQNSLECLRRSGDDRRVIAIGGGYAVVHAATGDLAQLAVDPARRRRGTGTRLLRHAAAVAAAPLPILNVDASSASIRDFLAAAGAEPFVAQLEMARATLDG